ncbi:MAG: DNA-3-methyladenine glycosylase 2 family protein [bacterium]|nr:DNA-3-methyladenine glycosylase 2 family protein [bacterium]
MTKVQLVKSHFRKVDPIIYQVIVEMNLEPLAKSKTSPNYFSKLCREIIAQQLAGKAATAITNRFSALFPKRRVTPDKVLALKEEDLRQVGMSWAKARYIRDLAQKIKNREVNLRNLNRLEDEPVVEELTKVKGIGRWTAEMFLMFTLGREDIFSHGDLGLRKAILMLYGLSDKVSRAEVEEIVAKWTPYKSYGCIALWESLEKQ